MMIRAKLFFVVCTIFGTVDCDTWTVLKNYDFSSMNSIRNDWNIIKWLPGFVNNELQNYVDNPTNIYTENNMLVVKAINQTQPCTVQYNKDIQGNDIMSRRGSVSQCCQFCRATPGCKTFSWNDYRGGTCWLKQGFYPVINNKAGGVLIGYLCDMTSGRLESKASFSPVNVPNKKLRVEYVAKVPTVMGAWPALWMLGQSGVYGNWPQEGEIDIMEWTWQLQGSIAASLHWKGPMDWSHHYDNLNMQELFQQFTTYGVEYSAVPNNEYVKFYMKSAAGDVLYSPEQLPALWQSSWHPSPACPSIDAGASQCSPLAPFDNRMTLIMNFAVGGDWGNCCGVNSYKAFNGNGVPFVIKSATVYQN